MSGVALSEGASGRLKRFKESPEFAGAPGDIAKSSYWKAHSSYLVSDITQGGHVTIDGQSGFYVPPSASALGRLRSHARVATAQPSRVVKALRTRFSARFGTPRFLSFAAAFDAVMSHHAIADAELSPWRVDHRVLSGVKGVFPTAAAVRSHYEAWSGRRATPHIFGHYYYQNLLRGHLPAGGLGTVLEIGAGNGNFPAILFHDWSPARFVLVDLPETIALAFVFLTSMLPGATIVLPNECGARGEPLPKDADFLLLSTEQIDRIETNSVDLAVNCHSFQEMTPPQIEIYFDLVQRTCRPGGHFLNANRVEKIPGAPDSHRRIQTDPPNRFAEYPWNPANHVLIYEVSRLLRLVLADDVSIRLERIEK